MVPSLASRLQNAFVVSGGNIMLGTVGNSNYSMRLFAAVEYYSHALPCIPS